MEGTLIVVFSKIVKSGIKEAVFIVLFLPLSLNSQVVATNNIPLTIKSKAPRRDGRSVKDS